MIKREYMLKKIRPFYESGLIKSIDWITSFWEVSPFATDHGRIETKRVKENQIIYINFEDFQYDSITNAKALYQYICEKRKMKINIICFLMKFRWFQILNV